MSINRVIISGNLTRDPELRSTAGGTSVLGFGVAVNDRRKNQQTGEWEVTIEGKLRWSQWERDGQKRSKIEVIVDELEFMSSRNSDAQYSSGQSYGQQGGYQPAPQASYQPQPAPTIDASSSVYDEDIPF